jgi:hypothetical protein
MTKKSDAEAAAARAARLHEQIEKLKDGGTSKRSDSTETEGAEPPMSPREFIQKRMRELDKKKDG